METTCFFTGGGPDFETDGLPPQALAYTMGVSITCFGESPGRFTAKYDLERRKGYTAHAGFCFLRFNGEVQPVLVVLRT